LHDHVDSDAVVSVEFVGGKCSDAAAKPERRPRRSRKTHCLQRRTMNIQGERPPPVAKPGLTIGGGF